MAGGDKRTRGSWRSALSVLVLLPLLAGADAPSLEQAGADYASIAKPLLARYCLDCHATDVLEGDLDLERFATLGDVRKDTAAWLKVAEMLDNGEMPPKDARRMPDADHRALRDWLARYLRAEALASAGDPGPVVIRRLSNAQYTYTLRDLTGVPLDPAREFPVDGAAGEGFTNTGGALVMSPALLSKYLDAAKGVAAHAVPLPDGLRFSPGTTRRDWTDEALEAIRSFYAEFTDSGGGTEVNLQGIVFGTNTGGRLPLERYLAATLAERDGLTRGARSLDDVARERRLSPKYLHLLWEALRGADPSPLLDGLRARWRAAGRGDVPALAAEVGRWQAALWKFNPVGHIGKVGGPTSWMEPVSPIRTEQQFRVAIAAPAAGEAVTLSLVADDAGTVGARGVVTWERPRLVAPGMPDLPIRDVPAVARALASRRDRIFAGAAGSLKAAAAAEAAGPPADRAALARRHDVPADVLDAWFDGLGFGDGGGPVAITGHLRGRLEKTAGYEFVSGWGSGATPNVLANASETHVRVPGNLKPHGVAMHPSPALRVVAGWQSPVTAPVRVAAKVQHAHPECGNGVTWVLELRRGPTRRRLASGVSQGARIIDVGPFPDVAVRRGDLIALSIGPRDGNHARR